ncbi:MAG: hypothetical protein ACLPTZ_18015 [Beijerinckiaceae bacterium]
MPPFVEPDEIALLVRKPAFRYGGMFLGRWKIGELADESGGSHVPLFFAQLAHLFDRLIQQFPHWQQCSTC